MTANPYIKKQNVTLFSDCNSKPKPSPGYEKPTMTAKEKQSMKMTEPNLEQQYHEALSGQQVNEGFTERYLRGGPWRMLVVWSGNGEQNAQSQKAQTERPRQYPESGWLWQTISSSQPTHSELVYLTLEPLRQEAISPAKSLIEEYKQLNQRRPADQRNPFSK